MIAGGPRRRAAALSAAVVFVLMFPIPAAAGLYARTNAPSALAWISLTDSRGISVWNYELSLDRGGGVIPSPGKMFWSALVDLCWGVYTSWVALGIWFLDWVLSGEWLALAASPFVTVGDAMQRVVTQLGVAPTFLMVTFCATTLWVARGRWATGVWEITLSLVIGALAVGIFANPVQKIAGTNGWIASTQSAGQDLSAELTGGEDTELSQAMVDAFIRHPAQLINFGEILDNGPCESAYTTVVRGGPYGGDDTIRDAVKACNEDLGEVAENPSIGMAMSAAFMVPGGGILVVLIGSVAGAVLAAGITLLWEGAKGAATLLAGILPGAARGPLFQSVGTIATRLALLFISSIFLGLVTLFVTALLSSGENTAKVFAIVDVMLLVSVYVWRRQRARLKAASERIAGALARRPGASPVRLPAPGTGPSVGPAVSKALQFAQLAATRRAAKSAGNIDNRTLIIAGMTGRVPPPPGRSTASPGGRPPLLSPGGGTSGPPPGPSMPPPGRPGGGGRARRVAGIATSAGLLMASGGTSGLATGARVARRATQARRLSKAALQDRLVPSPVKPSNGPVVPGRVVASRRIDADGQVVFRNAGAPR